MKMNYSGLLFSVLLSVTVALQGNDYRNPQSLTSIICDSRTDGRSSCAVELDVPIVCATTETRDPSCPIVFFLHGSGGNIQGFKQNSGVHDAGYIGVYPQGEKGWNTGPKNSNNCGWTDYSCSTDPNESDYIASIIEEVRSRGGTGNVYLSGNSNGAALAHRLASNGGTELPIRGIIVSVTQLLSSPERSGPGPLNYNQPSSSRGTPAVSVLSVMGTSDGLIPYDGGTSAVFGGDTNFQLMSAMKSMSTWASHNGCSGSFSTSSHSTNQGNLTATKYDYSLGCPSNILVEHYAIHGGKHNAGGAQIDGERINPLEFVARVEAANVGNPTTTLSPAASAIPSLRITSPPSLSPLTSTSPTSPASCSDDLSWRGKFSNDHTCEFVAEKPKSRCKWEDKNFVKASAACHVACNTCPTFPVSMSPSLLSSCSNDLSWRGKRNTKHTCDFVADNPEIRCTWMDKNNITATVGCRVACSTCPTSPPSMSHISSSPTDSPSLSLSCVDDTDFIFKKNDCLWLSKQKTNIRKRFCRKSAGTGCPKTCNSCPGNCQDDENFTFKLKPKSKKENPCSYITSKKNKIEKYRKKYCKTVGSSCPLSCGVC